MDQMISVIVPVYNVAPYLTNCLDSILNQSYKKLEIITVDDGSSDGSGIILDEYKERYPETIKVIHKENGGVTSARLVGVRAAKGKWIGFVDGDDEIETDMYERLLQNAVRFNAEISHCGYQIIVNKGERIHYFHNTGCLVLHNRYTGLQELIAGATEPSLCNKLFLYTLVSDLLNEDIIDLTIRYNEDFLMNYYLFCKAESSVFEDICPYHYMARITTATRGEFNLKKVLDPVDVAKTILDECSPDLKEAAWQRYLLCCFYAYTVLFEKEVYPNQTDELRLILIENRNKWRILRKRDQMKLSFALFSPKIYSCCYRYYKKNFQKKQYE